MPSCGAVEGRPCSDFGQVVGSRPPGSTAPVRTSASALPNSWPGNQASRMAADVVRPGEQDRRAGVDHHHRARVGGRHAGDQLVLAAGQGEVVAIDALALDLLVGADHHDGDVGLGGQRDGALELGLLVAERRLDVDVDGGHRKVGLGHVAEEELFVALERHRDAVLGRPQDRLAEVAALGKLDVAVEQVLGRRARGGGGRRR